MVKFYQRDQNVCIGFQTAIEKAGRQAADQQQQQQQWQQQPTKTKWKPQASGAF